MKVPIMLLLILHGVVLSPTDSLANQQPEGLLYQNFWPWVVALLIGLISAAVNLYGVNRLRKTNTELLNKQLAASKQQMQDELAANKDMMNKQLQANKEAIDRELKKKIHTENQQDWVDNLQARVEEIIELSATYNSYWVNKEQDLEVYRPLWTKLRGKTAALEIQLNNGIPSEKAIESALNRLVGAFNELPENQKEGFDQLKDKLIIACKERYQEHWRNINEL
jgi:hypothetical protein